MHIYEVFVFFIGFEPLIYENITPLYFDTEALFI